MAGSVNVFRYHHDAAYGLSGGIGIFEKFAPIGYPIPGYCRRFIPKNGSGRTLCLICAATTVVGTVTSIQPFVEYPGLEIASPAALSILLDVCRFHPSASGMRFEGAAFICWLNAKLETNREEKRRAKIPARLRFFIQGSVGRAEMCGKPVSLQRSPRNNMVLIQNERFAVG